MKKGFNLFLFIAAALVFVVSCKKDETKLIYNGGTTPALTTSANTLVLLPEDSTNNAVTLSWTDPAYSFSNGPSTLDVTYTIEIDSTDAFTKPQTINVVNELQKAFTVKDFNALLIKMGLKAGQTSNISIRVTSGLYFAGSKFVSNVTNITVTPYSVKPTPKYPVPAKLFIVGDATPGGWGNPVPEPAQQLTMIDETKFGIVINLTHDKHYLLLPTNGSWDHKYAAVDGNAIDNGAFQVDGGSDIPAPATDGLYKIIVDFVTGEYTVVAATPLDVPPAGLFIVGDATPGGWNNPVPTPSQQFTQVSSSGFEITIDLSKDKHYLLLPVNGSWDHKFAVSDNTIPEAKEAGFLTVDSGQDIPSPAEDGTYKIYVEFITRTYTVTKL